MVTREYEMLEQIINFFLNVIVLASIFILSLVLGIIGVAMLWEGLDEDNYRKTGFGLITAFLTISSLIITIYMILHGW